MLPQPKLLKGRKLTGLPVVASDLGKELGEVKEILYDADLSKICAILIEEGGWLKGAKLINWQDLQHIGDDVVTIINEQVILDSSTQKELQALCKQRMGLKGYKVMTEQGEELGTIEDILLNAVTGEIAGYELSRGVVQDLLDGRWEALLPPTAQIREQTVLIPEGQAYIYQPKPED